MKRLLSTQSLAAAALALGALAATSSAQAHTDVQFTIGVQVPGLYVQSVPLYVQPRPVYVPAFNHFRRFEDRRRFERPHWRDRDGYEEHYRDDNRFQRDDDRHNDGGGNPYERRQHNPNHR